MAVWEPQNAQLILGQTLTMTAGQQIILATLLFSFMNICVKQVSHLPTEVVVFFRGLIALILCAVPLIYRRINPFRNKELIPYLVLRGLFGTLALLLFFYTVQTIPLATAVTIQLLSPIFSVILAQILLKEAAGLKHYLFLLLSFLGVLLVKGFDTSIPLKAIAMGVASALASACAYTAIRKIGQRARTVVIIFYFPLITTIALTPRIIQQSIDLSLVDGIWLILIGVTVQFAQIFMTRAYASAQASGFVNYSYLGVVYALFWGWFLFDEIPRPLALAGMAIIVVSAWASRPSSGSKLPS